jgi:hypothetical protein
MQARVFDAQDSQRSEFRQALGEVLRQELFFESFVAEFETSEAPAR